MERLWNYIQSHLSKSRSHAVFLAAWTALWVLGTLAVGLLFIGLAAGSTFLESFGNVLCVAAYAGIIFGWFGGVFFLMRKQD